MTHSAPGLDLRSPEQVLAALPVRKTRRWLIEYLHRHPLDAGGRPLYRRLGRDWLIYYDRLIDSLPGPRQTCRSKSSSRATRAPKTSTSGAATSASLWIELAALTGDPSLAAFSSGSNKPSSAATGNVIPIRRRRR
jgi:hypothetical protein